ncbi:MAG: two-component response regulator [Deltaproteobacteria bacterium]|jgi:CheY-like chemotaxis protein|nr:two-component response regulator [Deltaproteobacteria bacterium]
MTDVAKLFEGLAAVAWPAIVILVILLFRPVVAALIESARSRKFTLKLGGQELTMEEASEQQRKLIADLQTQVLEIRKSLEGTVQPAEVPPEAAQTSKPPVSRSVLWVDDQPKNNSYFVQQLSDKGVSVDLALSGSEGLRLFDNKTYGVVISDMGRTEDGTYKPTAGLELLQRIRERNKTIPFIIFSSSRGVRQHRDTAANLGATAMTSSPTEMFGILESAIGEKT